MHEITDTWPGLIKPVEILKVRLMYLYFLKYHYKEIDQVIIRKGSDCKKIYKNLKSPCISISHTNALWAVAILFYPDHHCHSSQTFDLNNKIGRNNDKSKKVGIIEDFRSATLKLIHQLIDLLK